VDTLYTYLEGDIKPILRETPEADLEFVFWTRLLGEYEAALECVGIPSELLHIMRLNDQGLPELIGSDE
jgi:hypothetical protein